MKLTSAHLRYLLCIYNLSKKCEGVSCSGISRALKVSKPSVSAMLGALNDKGVVKKEPYGKVYLTDDGYMIAQQVEKSIQNLQEKIPLMGVDFSKDETEKIACIIATEMPEKFFTSPSLK